MPSPRWVVAGAITATVLTLNLAAVDAAAGFSSTGSDAGHRPAPSARQQGPSTAMTRLDQHSVDKNSGPVPYGAFVGDDGLLYEGAPLVVPGNNGVLFLGPDFDTSCSDGKRFAKGLRRLAHLAAIVRASGRRVILTVAPNKSTAEPSTVATLPHGACDQLGIDSEAETMRTFSAPDYVSPLAQLLKTSQPYWNTDAHWSTVGATVFAREIAQQLSPSLAKKQRYRPTPQTRVGDLETYISGQTPETVQGLLPDNGVTTVPAAGSPTFDPTFTTLQLDNSWISTPASKTYKGKTLLLGDSFMYTSLQPMRNLFHDGHFLWTGISPTPTIVTAMQQSDTVVIEVVQRFVSASVLWSTAFIKTVKAGLAHHQLHHGGHSGHHGSHHGHHHGH